MLAKANDDRHRHRGKGGKKGRTGNGNEQRGSHKNKETGAPFFRNGAVARRGPEQQSSSGHIWIDRQTGGPARSIGEAVGEEEVEEADRRVERRNRCRQAQHDCRSGGKHEDNGRAAEKKRDQIAFGDDPDRMKRNRDDCHGGSGPKQEDRAAHVPTRRKNGDRNNQNAAIERMENQPRELVPPRKERQEVWHEPGLIDDDHKSAGPGGDVRQDRLRRAHQIH
ncbi:hypothetical protein MesoLj113a_27990 [Mesorhizobium sp. 113-1-2]|nr:Uncharacterized protein MLTONO_2186 [Mesorhizobium loti]BCG71641.1 hypothetical protein MesoLj113a_27990 [Mesorhizobium sp. 113-1-2]